MCIRDSDYAEEFAVDYYNDGYALITISNGTQYLVIPEGKPEPSGLDENIVQLHQPIQNIYLVASAVMDMFVSMDALDTIRFSALKSDGWYLSLIHILDLQLFYQFVGRSIIFGQYNGGFDYLSAHRVGRASHCTFQHSRMLHQHAFDFKRPNPIAGSFDDIVGTANIPVVDVYKRQVRAETGSRL